MKNSISAMPYCITRPQAYCTAPSVSQSVCPCHHRIHEAGRSGSSRGSGTYVEDFQVDRISRKARVACMRGQ